MLNPLNWNFFYCVFSFFRVHVSERETFVTREEEIEREEKTFLLHGFTQKNEVN